MSFEEYQNWHKEFPSLAKDFETNPTSNAIFRLYGRDEVIQKYFQERLLDKQRVKQGLIKHIKGSQSTRSPVCEKPYGDKCGYCFKCGQHQELILNALFQELGLED